MCLLGLAGLLPPSVLAVGLLSLLDPTYPARLLGFTQSMSGAGATDLLLAGRFAEWWDLFTVWGYPTLHHRLHSALLLLGTGGGLLLLAAARPLPGATRLLAGATLLALALISLAVVPWNKIYGAMTAGLLLPALAVALAARPGAVAWRAGRLLLLGTLAALLLAQLPFAGQRLAMQAYRGASLERMTLALEQLDLRDRTGDGAVWIFADPFAFFLLRPREATLVSLASPWADGPAQRALADYLVFSYPGSGDPMTPHRPDWWPEVAPTMELLYRPALPQQPRLFGRALSGSSQTWELEIWGRR